MVADHDVPEGAAVSSCTGSPAAMSPWYTRTVTGFAPLAVPVIVGVAL